MQPDALFLMHSSARRDKVRYRWISLDPALRSTSTSTSLPCLWRPRPESHLPSPALQSNTKNNTQPSCMPRRASDHRRQCTSSRVLSSHPPPPLRPIPDSQPVRPAVLQYVHRCPRLPPQTRPQNNTRRVLEFFSASPQIHRVLKRAWRLRPCLRRLCGVSLPANTVSHQEE